MTHEEWINKYLENDRDSGMRVGQSYMVRVHPKMSNTELWNERSHKKAWAMIDEIKKDYQI